MVLIYWAGAQEVRTGAQAQRALGPPLSVLFFFQEKEAAGLLSLYLDFSLTASQLLSFFL